MQASINRMHTSITRMHTSISRMHTSINRMHTSIVKCRHLYIDSVSGRSSSLSNYKKKPRGKLLPKLLLRSHIPMIIVEYRVIGNILLLYKLSKLTSLLKEVKL